MKSKYIAPVTLLTSIKTSSHILCTSVVTLEWAGDGNGLDGGSRKRNNLWDDED